MTSRPRRRAPEAAPATVAKYRLIEEIGSGAMGTVYLAHDPFTDRPIALKLTRRESEDAALYERLFFNETRAAGLLQHPNVVRVYDAGHDDVWFYIAMEYVPGGRTLEPHCRRGHLLPLARVAEIVFKCAEALDYSHRKGVVHRDVKPSNILLAEGGAVKVADFGVALLTDPAIADTQLMAAGSPLYMSPEQVRGDAVTNQSDLFSLGIVLFEALTGHHPFAAETLAAVTHRVLNEKLPPVTRLRPGVPRSLEAIVDRATAKETGDRYSSAWDLAADLSQAFTELEHPQDGITAEGRADLLKRLDFFRAFDDAEIWELLRWAHWEEHAPGAEIITEGEEGDALFMVVSGRVEVRKGTRVVAELEPGQFVGEIAYLNRQRRTATVLAREATSVLCMNAASLDRASDRCQLQFQRVFIETLISRLVQTTAALARQG